MNDGLRFRDRHRVIYGCLKWTLVGFAALMLLGIATRPGTPDPSSGCRPAWHPAVYCAPGYTGPAYKLVRENR